MEAMNELMKEIMQTLEAMKDDSRMQAFKELMEKIEGKGVLSTKTKELIAVSLSVVKQCKWCIAFHVKNALNSGASPEEIMEAAWVAVLMGGGPALMYMQLVAKALGDFKE